MNQLQSALRTKEKISKINKYLKINWFYIIQQGRLILMYCVGNISYGMLYHRVLTISHIE